MNIEIERSRLTIIQHTTCISSNNSFVTFIKDRFRLVQKKTFLNINFRVLYIYFSNPPDNIFKHIGMVHLTEEQSILTDKDVENLKNC